MERAGLHAQDRACASAPDSTPARRELRLGLLPCPNKNATEWQSKLVECRCRQFVFATTLRWPILAAAAVRTARALKSEPLLLVAARLELATTLGVGMQSRRGQSCNGCPTISLCRLHPGQPEMPKDIPFSPAFELLAFMDRVPLCVPNHFPHPVILQLDVMPLRPESHAAIEMRRSGKIDQTRCVALLRIDFDVYPAVVRGYGKLAHPKICTCCVFAMLQGIPRRGIPCRVSGRYVACLDHALPRFRLCSGRL